MSIKVTDLTKLYERALPDHTVGRIDIDDCTDISNGIADLERSVEALLFIYNALSRTTYHFENDEIASSIMLAINKIEEVEMVLRKIEIKE